MPEALKIIYTTCGNAKDAERMARALVKGRLVACANIVPGVVSVFRWQGKVQREKEVAILFKTRSGRVKKAVKRLLALHPYDVPAVEVWGVTDVPKAFKKWVDGETS